MRDGGREGDETMTLLMVALVALIPMVAAVAGTLAAGSDDE